MFDHPDPQSTPTLDPATSRAAVDLGRVLVVGGTGKTGRRVVDLLRAGGVEVRSVSRSSTPRFDWDDVSTWAAALDGVHAAYLTYAPDLAFPGADLQLAALGAELTAHGVARVVLLSGRGEPTAAVAEDALLAQVPTARIVRGAWFAQNFTEGLLADAVATGTIALPVPAQVPEPFVDLDDLAEVVLRLLVNDTLTATRYELTGPTAITFVEVAETLGRRLGRPIDYVQVEPAAFIAASVTAGWTEGEARGLAELFAELFDGRNVTPTTTVAELLGRAPRSFADVVRTAEMTA